MSNQKNLPGMQPYKVLYLVGIDQAGLKNPREKRESYLDQMFDSVHMQNGA